MKLPQIGQTPPPALVALSDANRRIANALLRVEGEPDALAELTRSLAEMAERLESLGSSASVPLVMAHLQDDDTPKRPYYFPGALEPRAHVAMPWVTATQEARRRFGQVRFELLHEGPPGCVHGGHLAWMFDQAFGQHVVASELGGPTHRLEMTYRKPTPVLETLDYEVRTDRLDGRKLFVTGTLRHGGALTAEASAIFVRPKEVKNPFAESFG